MNMNQSTTAANLIKAVEVVIYSIRGISVIGTLFNISTIIVLTRPKFRHNFYNFLRCRCCCNLFVCLVGIFFYDLPDIETQCDYISLLFIWNVTILPMRVAFLSSFISDNLLVLNRLLNLYEMKSSIFYRLSKKVIL